MRRMRCVVYDVYLFGGLMGIAARRTVRRQTSSSRFWQTGIMLLGAWLLFVGGTGDAWLDAVALPVTADVALTGMAITAAGGAFAIWGGLSLCTNLGGKIT